MSMAESRTCLYGPSALEAWRRFDNRVPGIPVFGHTERAGPVLSKALPARILRSTADSARFDLNLTFLDGYDFDRWGVGFNGSAPTGRQGEADSPSGDRYPSHVLRRSSPSIFSPA